MKNAYTRNRLLAVLLTTLIVPSIRAQPTITGNPPPWIQIYTGSTAYLSVTANDSSTMSYQWMVGPTNGSSYANLANGGNISGANSATLVISNVGPTNVASYIVTVNDPASVQSTATILTVLPAPTDLYGATVMSNSPLAFWRMNETSGTNLYDYAGGFNGYYAGGVTLNQLGIAPTGLPGDTNPSVLFDGVTGYAEVPSYGVIQSNLVFTVEIWGDLFDPANFISRTYENLAIQRAAGAPYDGWEITTQVGESEILFGGGLNSGYIYPTGDNPTAGPMTNNQWSLLTMSCDGTNVYSYLNGSLTGEINLASAGSTGYVPSYGAPMFIGVLAALNISPEYFWQGKITEAAIYPTALNSNVISNHWVVGMTGGLVAPIIALQPLPAALYAGQTATFLVQANCAVPISWQWMGAPAGTTNYTNLNNGANIFGVTSNTLTITNIAVANAGNYVVVVTSSLGSVTSSVAPLTVQPLPTDGYGVAVLSSDPAAYWRLNETSGTVVYDYVGGNNGTYHGNVQLDQTRTGSADTQPCVLFDGSTAYVAVPWSNVLNYANSSLNSSSFSVECWVNATGATGAPMTPMANQNTLNNDTEGYNIYASSGSWNFEVGNNKAGFTSAAGPSMSNGWTHLVGTYNGISEIFYVNGQAVVTNAATFSLNQGEPLVIGAGGNDQPTPSNFWTGLIAEAAVYSNALSPSQVEQHFLLGSTGIVPLPNFTQEPQSLNLYAGRNASFTAQVSSDAPLTYQWMGAPAGGSSYTNVRDGGNISGAISSQLVISNVSLSNAGNYLLVASNSAGTTNSTVATLMVVAAPTDLYGETILSNNPVAYWRMNETSGTTMYDYVGGHNGAYTGGVTLGLPGIGTNDTNLAAKFDGSTGYAQVPYAAALNSSPFTVEYWVNPTSGAGGTPFANQDTQIGSGGDDGYTFSFSSGSWTLLMGSSAFGWSQFTGSAGAVGQWTDVAETFDGTTVELYLDGTNFASGTVLGGYTPNPVEPLNIGAGNNDQSPANFWPGYITEAAVFNTALTANQIKTHYNVATVGSFSPPTITNQPGSTLPTPYTLQRYATENGSLTVGASSLITPVSYQWQVQSGSSFVNLVNGGSAPSISGTTTNTLTLGNIPTSYNGSNIQVVVANAAGSVTSSVIALSITAAPTDPYGAQVVADGPSAYWRMNETSGPIFYDYAGGNNGTWGSGITVGSGIGISSRTANQSVSYPGVSSLNNVGQVPYNYALESVSNISIEVWFNSTGYNGKADQFWMCVQNRYNSTGAPGPTTEGPAILIVNNSTPAITGLTQQYGLGAGTFDTINETIAGHIPTYNTWSYAVTTYDGTQAKLYFNGYLVNTTALSTYVPVTNSRDAILFGNVWAPTSSSSGTLAVNSAGFCANGYECEAAVYPFALTAYQVTNHYYQATGTALVGPTSANITYQPQSTNLYVDQTATFTITNSWPLPLTYQWMVESNGVYVNLATNAGNPNISSVTAATLTITNVSLAIATNYEVVMSYPGFPSLTSSPALLTVVQPAAIDLNYTYAANVLTLTWTNSDFVLMQATNLLGPWTASTNTSGVQISPTNAQAFYRLQAP